VQYYDSNSGLFYAINANGVLTPLSNKKFFQVKNVTWSGDNKKAVLEYPDGSNIVYDFATDSQVTLPKHWQDFSFSSDGGKIISKSIGADVNNQWLIISDTNGANAKVIAALGGNADKVQVAWSPSNQVVGFSATGDPTSEFGTQEIYLIGQNKENFKSLKVQGLNFKAAWAKEGDRLIYNVANPANGYRPALWVTDASGDNVGSNTAKVNLNTTIDKCAIVSGYKAYCAVPKDLPEGAGLDMSIVENTQDSFYFVNLRTGATSLIGEPSTSYNVSQISVSSDEKYIYFTDAANNGLHQIKIQ
jgi:dipeptidyl aminopeptidase/acylaminoacyl peptidase